MNSYTDPAIRITLLPRDTNSAGTIFGGVILSYIDMAGAIEAHRRTRMDRFVTVAMREVIFHKPVFVGDLVSFYSRPSASGQHQLPCEWWWKRSEWDQVAIACGSLRQKLSM